MCRSWLVLAGIVLSAGCGTPPAATSPAPTGAAPRGHLLIVGGGPRPVEMMRHFVELAGGPGRARILVLPMASGVPEEVGPDQAEELRALGAEARSLNLSRAEATSDTILGLFEGITGVWFSGGDQSRLTAAIHGTLVDSVIHVRYREGAAIGGTSAGAAVMSRRMITGEERRPGGDRPPASQSAADAFLTIDRDNVVVEEGFGLLPAAIVDQHFVRRKRHNRLISLVLEHPEEIGVGIDESTALQVNPDGSWTVVGASSVVVYDARGARITSPEAPVLGAAEVRLHVLPAGSTFHPRTGRVILPTDIRSRSSAIRRTPR